MNKDAAGLDSMCCLMGNPTDGYTPNNQLPTVELIKPSTWSQDSPLRSDRKRRLSVVNGRTTLPLEAAIFYDYCEMLGRYMHNLTILTYRNIQSEKFLC